MALVVVSGGGKKGNGGRGLARGLVSVFLMTWEMFSLENEKGG